MPIFLLALGPVAKELWALRYLVLSIALVGLFWWYSVHERNIGAAACKAEVEQATAKEHQRRVNIEQWAQQWAAGAIKNVDTLDAKNAQLQADIARSVASVAGHACLPRSVVDGLRRIH